MKRYLSIVLAIALLAFSVPTSLAAGSAILEFNKTSETIAAGGTTSVSLALRKYDNSAFALGGLQACVKIPSQFDLVLVPGKLALGDTDAASRPGYVTLYNDSGNITPLDAANPLITFTLTANATAVPGETYEVAIATGEDNLFYDTDWNEVTGVDFGGAFQITIEADEPDPDPVFTFGVTGSGTAAAPYVYSVTKPVDYVGDYYVVAQTYNAAGEFAGMAAYKNSAAGDITIGTGLTAKFMLISAFDNTATVLAPSVVK